MRSSPPILNFSGGTVTDGPFPESKELVGGYVMIEAETVEAAAELAKGCPILAVAVAVIYSFRFIWKSPRS